LVLIKLSTAGALSTQYGSVKGERRRRKGEGKTFNPYPLTFSPNQILVQNAYPNGIDSALRRLKIAPVSPIIC